MVEDVENHWSYDLLENFLKSHFAGVIGTPRHLECAADLIDFLERRDLIPEQNMEVLRHCNFQQLQEVMCNYEVVRKEAEPVNEYSKMRMADDFRQKSNVNGNSMIAPDTDNTMNNTKVGAEAVTHPMALSERQRAAIYKLLSQKLGTSWRPFGRELSLREGDMDEIELQCPRDLSTRIYKVLERFEKDDCIDPKQHLQLIREALEQCRRKDVRRQVDAIMSH